MTTPATTETVTERLHSELIDLGIAKDDISDDAKLDELDIDSLDVADLMAMVGKEFKVEIPRSQLADMTIGQLVDRIVEGWSH
jgi:acyl carrier protein